MSVLIAPCAEPIRVKVARSVNDWQGEFRVGRGQSHWPRRIWPKPAELQSAVADIDGDQIAHRSHGSTHRRVFASEQDKRILPLFYGQLCPRNTARQAHRDAM